MTNGRERKRGYDDPRQKEGFSYWHGAGVAAERGSTLRVVQFVAQLLEFTRAEFEALSDLPTVAANRHHQAANVRHRSFLDHAQERAGSRHSSCLREM